MRSIGGQRAEVRVPRVENGGSARRNERAVRRMGGGEVGVRGREEEHRQKNEPALRAFDVANGR